MGVPPNHPFLFGILHKPSSYWGTPMTMEAPIYQASLSMSSMTPSHVPR